MKNLHRYFSTGELLLWGGSLLLILGSAVLFGQAAPLPLSASLIGATALLFCAKGNPIGQLLVIVFSVLYGVISWGYRYYGEVITYLGMSAPMAVVAFVTWLKNPFQGNRAEVTVSRLRPFELWLMPVLTAVVTLALYFPLRRFGTENLIVSTVSVTTSFLAMYLSFRRSPYFALAYALNDVVLIVLWALATAEQPRYLAVVICFVVFLVNDIYGFVSWLGMRRRQQGA